MLSLTSGLGLSNINYFDYVNDICNHSTIFSYMGCSNHVNRNHILKFKQCFKQPKPRLSYSDVSSHNSQHPTIDSTGDRPHPPEVGVSPGSTDAGKEYTILHCLSLFNLALSLPLSLHTLPIQPIMQKTASVKSRGEDAVGDLEKPHIEHNEALDLFTPQERKELTRRIDLRLVVTLGCLYCISLLDRTNLGAASVAGYVYLIPPLCSDSRRLSLT